ncbi:MAG TPA: acetyltransferase [Bryobacteraceae bacterium]|nr:acetyltransferase [Bryobacteraceae bacterium]
MPAELLILGAGGASREIAGAVADVNRAEPRWKLLGFLDDDPAKQDTHIDGLRVLGTIDSARRSTARIVIGVARWQNPCVRRNIVERLALPRERYATIIHPSASVSPYAQVGNGTAILQNVVITPGTAIGDHVLVMQNVTMAHDQVVEDFVTIAPGAVIAGAVRLKQGCYIGARSVIMNGVTVNEGALVGIGSVVLRDVPAGRTASGNPAHQLPELRRH